MNLNDDLYKCFLFIPLITIFQTIVFSSNDFVKMKIYLLPWTTRYSTPTTTDNIHKRTDHFFHTKELTYGEYTIFEDYETWIEFMSKQSLFESDKNNGFVTSYVIVYFKYRKIKIFFDYRGRFNYKNKWYNKNDELYLSIFCFFSDYLVSSVLLKECEDNFKNSQKKTPTQVSQ